MAVEKMCALVDEVAPPSTAELVRARLKALKDQRKYSQVKVAERLGMVASNVSRTINNESRPLTLAFLEAIAEEAGVPLAELIAPAGSLVKQLDPREAALLRHLRALPTAVTQHLYEFLNYFDREPPFERQKRNLDAYWRKMSSRERDWLYGVVVMLREGTLTEDLRAGLVDRLKREQYSRESDAAKKKRSERQSDDDERP